MQISRSTEESVRLIASALGSIADTVTKLAGSLEEIEARVEHIEEYLESLEIVEEEETPEEEQKQPLMQWYDRNDVLLCSMEDDGSVTWEGEGGFCPPEKD